ncbi:MFS transporter [Enterovirga rhinocerotis]|uniref:Putative MFS family arabinose efflux permease n=1 Tax=Enterovirga rhinocerotis TaxID=1339210 RepID=A0A4R7CCB4_9HYPH|nr:MFS transporter [Enterovirga rhinocerotis]TDR94786.1 putative MFS family arabinose efflux permease [Enterovirga rhinocerotis]
MTSPAAASTDPAEVRRTILILSVCGFASALSTRFVDPMITVIARDLEADPLRVALLSTAYALPYALIQLVLGPIGDALGKELVTKIIMVVLTVTTLACAAAPDLTTLFVFRVLSGMAAGGIIPMGLATIGDRVRMVDRQVAIGRFLTAVLTGQLLGGIGAGLVADGFGWRGVFLFATLLTAASTVAVLIGFRGYRSAGGELSFASAGRRYRSIIAIGRVRWLVLFVFAEGILVYGVHPYIAAMLEASGTGGPTEAGIAIAAFAVGGILYTLVVRWLLNTLGLFRMLRVAGFIAGAGYLALAPVLPAWVAAIGLFVVGIGFYMLHNSFQTQITEMVPTARASAVSLHAFGFFIGQALGPVLFGLVLASQGRATALIACACGLVVLGLTAGYVLSRPASPAGR